MYVINRIIVTILWFVDLDLIYGQTSTHGLITDPSSKINNPICAEEDTKLYENGRISAAFSNLLTRYNATCTPEQCNIAPSDPLEGFLSWDYNGVGFVMKRQCERNRNYKACEVDTKVYHRAVQDSIEVRAWVVESNKGICFPPSCSDDQVSLLDPTPGQCNPTSMDCTIVSYDVRCPSRRTENTGTCLEDSLAPVSPFYVSRGVTEAAIVADCVSMFSGTGTIGLCEASTGAVNANFKTDFTDFEKDPFYKRHTVRCEEEGGMLCLFDMHASISIPGEAIKIAISEVVPLTDAGDITIGNTFTKFPRCIARQCDIEDMQDVLVHHANEYFFDVIGLPCDLNSGGCTMDINNVQCFPTETSPPTFTPVSSSDTPSSSPFKVVSDEPSITISGGPSDIHSVAPSISSDEPTTSPSIKISAGPSDMHSEVPSLSSDEPTTSPSIKISAGPSDMHSEVPSLSSDEPITSPSITIRNDLFSTAPTPELLEQPSNSSLVETTEVSKLTDENEVKSSSNVDIILPTLSPSIESISTSTEPSSSPTTIDNLSEAPSTSLSSQPSISSSSSKSPPPSTFLLTLIPQFPSDLNISEIISSLQPSSNPTEDADISRTSLQNAAIEDDLSSACGSLSMFLTRSISFSSVMFWLAFVLW